eukprot:544581_1
MLLNTGAKEGGEDHDYDNDLQLESPLNDPALISFVNQNKLSEKIASSLAANEVSSLDDLKLLQSENDIKEFVNELGLKFIDRKKLTSAIKKLQSNQSHESDEKSGAVSKPQLDEVVAQEEKVEIKWKDVTIMSKYHNANKDDSKNSDFEATKSTSKNNMNEEPCY